MALYKTITDLKKWDDQRSGFAGEHWFVLGAAVLAMRQASRSKSALGRMMGGVVGSALLARAASDREGLVGMIKARSGRASLLSRRLPFLSGR